MPAGLENVEKAGDVAGYVYLGVRDGIADPGLSREIYRDVEPFAGKSLSRPAYPRNSSCKSKSSIRLKQVKAGV